MPWIILSFETTICFPDHEISVNYEGVEIKIRPVSTESYADVSIEFKDDRNALKYRNILRRFLNALAWLKRKPIYERLEIGGTERGRVGKNFIDHGIGHLDIDYLPDVSKDQDQALALSLYRNALGVDSLPAATIDLLRIFEIKLGSNSRRIRDWINKQVAKINEVPWQSLPPHKLEAKSSLIDLQKRLQDINVGDHLYYTARCSSAHAAVEPNDPYNPEHNTRLRKDLCIIWSLVDIFIEEELGIPSDYRNSHFLPSFFTSMKLSGMLDK